MVQPALRATVRKAAPTFEAAAWWQGRFQQVSLEQFRGNLTDQIKRRSDLSHVFCPLSRLVCRPLLLAPRLHLRVPNRDLPV